MTYIRKMLEKRNVLRQEEMASKVADGLSKQLNNMRLPIITSCMAIFYLWCRVKDNYPEVSTELESAYAKSKEPVTEE